MENFFGWRKRKPINFSWNWFEQRRRRQSQTLQISTSVLPSRVRSWSPYFQSSDRDNVRVAVANSAKETKKRLLIAKQKIQNQSVLSTKNCRQMYASRRNRMFKRRHAHQPGQMTLAGGTSEIALMLWQHCSQHSSQKLLCLKASEKPSFSHILLFLLTFLCCLVWKLRMGSYRYLPMQATVPGSTAISPYRWTRNQ